MSESVKVLAEPQDLAEPLPLQGEAVNQIFQSCVLISHSVVLLQFFWASIVVLLCTISTAMLIYHV